MVFLFSTTPFIFCIGGKANKMGKKAYLATGIAVIAAIALILSSGVSYFTDTEEVTYNTFIAGVSSSCQYTFETNKSTEPYITYTRDCDIGCDCGEMDEQCLSNCLATIQQGTAVGRIVQCLNRCGDIPVDANDIAPGAKDVYTYNCYCDWGGDQ